MSKGFASSYRIGLLALSLFLTFGTLGGRLVWLHVVDRESLLRGIPKARHQTLVEKARRGDILDESGAILATSRSMIVLGVDPRALIETSKEQQKWPQLAALIGMPEAELRGIFRKKVRPPAPAIVVAPATVVPAAATPPSRPANPAIVFDLFPAPVEIAAVAPKDEDDDTQVEDEPDTRKPRVIKWARLRDDIPEQLFLEIKKLGIKGITGDRVYRRVYPNNQLAAHIVGYVNRAEQPAAGMEAYANFYLRGQDGWRVGERDGHKQELAQFRTREVPKADGYSVWLSIDSTVQDIVEQELVYIAQKYEPLKATIIVSEPHTGFILGMANYPTFNLNAYNQVPAANQWWMKNAAVADVYEPGSVFKIVAVSAALEERLVSSASLFDCSLDRFLHRGRILSLPGEDHHFKNPTAVSLAEVVSHSSNRGAAQLGMRLGEERFHSYARKFGFGGKLGFPVGGEVSGLFRPLKDWDPIDITRVPIGHSISATALQMHQAMTVIANDGVLLRPQVIRQVRDAAGETVYRFDRTEIGRVVSVPTARLVAQMLTAVASKNGTAAEAAIDGYDVAGKTGTTIKLMEEIQPDGTKKHYYDRKRHIASFVGFFPAGRPQIAISVIVDEADRKAPNGIAYGGRVAAPSFKRIGERLIPLRKIQSHSQPAIPSLLAANEGGRR